MKRFIKYSLALSILLSFVHVFVSCRAQTNEFNNIDTLRNKPKIDIKVNKQYDENGNIIGYDSTYSYSYSSNGNTFNFGNNIMFNDSLFIDNFMNTDSLFNEDFNNFDSPFLFGNFNGMFNNSKMDEYFKEQMKRMEKMMNELHNQQNFYPNQNNTTPNKNKSGNIITL